MEVELLCSCTLVAEMGTATGLADLVDKSTPPFRGTSMSGCVGGEAEGWRVRSSSGLSILKG